VARTGVFGGTFDPPHLGHLIVAQDVAEALELDRLLMVPAAAPPLNSDAEPAPAELRALMLAGALGDDPRLEMSRIELDRGGLSYTVDTLTSLAADHPEDELFLAIGVDQLRAFSTWRAPAEIARLARIVVMAREGAEPDGEGAGVGMAYETVAVTRVDVSSTEIRRRVREGRSIRYWVPEAVRRIIDDERLYGARQRV
jgi:nicotinate-nucleotide adenylyltransferase